MAWSLQTYSSTLCCRQQVSEQVNRDREVLDLSIMKRLDTIFLNFLLFLGWCAKWRWDDGLKETWV